MASSAQKQETEEEPTWHKEEVQLTEKSGIDLAVASRKASLSSILSSFIASDDLVAAIVALGEATAHIAVHLQNYVEHIYAGSQNASGDEQLHLDIVCDEEVFRAVRQAGDNNDVYATVASEETPVETTIHENGKYSLGCDPLDGSSIIDANFSVGSIFGIWPGKTLVGRKGKEQVAAAVSLYGPRTLFLLAVPGQNETKINRVLEFTLVENRTKWEVSREQVHIEPHGKVFAPGNLRAVNDSDKYKQMIDYWMNEKYQLRYSGGMVPDVYHIFAKSKGIFANVSSQTAKAKLRLLYEVAPLGLIVECAGGMAIHEDHDESVLDIIITHTDQRLGVCFGSSAEVQKYKDIMFC